MKIAVVGAGVVGGYFGGHLAHAGEDVVFVERGRTLRSLRQNGLRIEDVDADFTVQPASATDDPGSIGIVDVILLAVKGWQVEGAIETLRPLMGPHTWVVPLMDGIEAPDQLAAALGRDRVAAGVAIMLGSAVSPGHIRNKLPHTSLTIGELDGRLSERIAELRNVLERAGITTRVSTDIVSARWGKLMLVGPWSAVGAVTRAPLGFLRTVRESRRLVEQAMREVLAVARAQGASLSEDNVYESLDLLDAAPAEAVGNLRDIIDGRPSELETEVGAVIRAARKVGVAVPCHSFLYASLLPQEQKARGETDCNLASPRSGDPAQNRAAVERHWTASASGDLTAEYETYDDDVLCEYPQSGEKIEGRSNLRALRSQHPDRPGGFHVRRIVGGDTVWVTEYVIDYNGGSVPTVSIMEFRDGRVFHETQYFAQAFKAPAWRARWTAHVA